MEQDIQNLLKKNLELTKENNKLLKKIRRGALMGGFLKLIWVAILVVGPIYIYFSFLSPMLDQALGAAQAVQDVGDKAAGVQGQLQEQLEIRGLDKILNIFNR